jgi:hypothetical protein
MKLFNTKLILFGLLLGVALIPYFSIVQRGQLTEEQRKKLADEKKVRELQPLRNFLKNRGLLQNADDLKEILKKTHVPPQFAEHWMENLDYNAYLLARDGITSAKVQKLKERGIDVIKTKSGWERPSLAELAVLAELVIIGEVKDVVYTLEPDDGFHSSTIISVKEVLVGTAPANELTIRQMSGQISNDRILLVSTDLRAKKGEVYLFFLSNTGYRFHLELPGKGGKVRSDLPENVKASYFVHGRAHQIKNGKIYSAPDDGANPNLDNLEDILSEIRGVGKILKEIR